MALVAGLLLPLGTATAARQGQNVPTPFPSVAAPAAPPPQAPAPSATAESYVSAWTVPLEGAGPLFLTFTSSSLLLAGDDIPIEARALDDGRVLWTSARQADTAPVAAGDLVLATSGPRLVALDAASGQDTWMVELPAPPQPLVVAGDTILVATGATLVVRRAADGVALWAATLGANASAPPVASDALVVVALDDRTLAAFDRATGAPAWRAPLDVTALAMRTLGDRLFISAAEGFACAHKLEHGRKDWCFPVRVKPIGAAVGNERLVFYAFLDNMVHVFDRRSGRRYFTPSLDALPAAGPTLTSDFLIVPVVTGEFVLLALGDRLTLSRVSTPRALDLPSTRAAAVAPDGSALAMVTTSAGARYSLAFFSRKAAAAPAEPLRDAETKTDDTASDTPPAPTAP